MLLVTQPTFLFSNRDYNYNGISAIGFIIVFLSSITRATLNLSIKYTKNINLSLETTIIVPQIVMSTIIVIVFIFGVCIPQIDWNANIFIIENASNNNNNNNTSSNSFYIVSLGILCFIWVVAGAVGFRRGKLGRLGIVQNVEAVIAYTLDGVLLHEDENYLCYIGVVLTLIGCAIVFYEQLQYQQESESLQNEQAQVSLSDHDDV